VSSKLAVVVPLGIAQTLAWASSYYLLAILAEPIARDTHVASTAVFAAFSAALLISAAIGPHVGRTIDRFGGRLVLMLSNVCFAVGLALLAASDSWPLLCLAWFFIGIGMGMGLYDAAFAALARLYGIAARSPITAITLMAGFASTVGWPLTAWGLDNLGWRETCLGWALVHLIIGIPLNASLPNTEGLPAAEDMPEGPVLALDRTMWLLAFAFAAAWAISTAMAAHLPRLLESVGASPSQALFAGILIGPAQVADVRVTTKDCDWLCVHPHSISAPTVPLCRNASPSSLASR
jgi:MFS family permease